MNNDTSAQQRRLDLAARAAWLYYIKGRTQDEIAAELNVSRQNAQRLVALANAERLIKFRLDHPLATCIELAQRCRDRFALDCCEVAPSERNGGEDDRLSVGILAARFIEDYMAQNAPVILAMGTGRTLREAVRQVPSMDRPQHKILSVVGNITRDGQASPYDVVMRLADRVGAQCYPLPTPVVTETRAEREMLQAQRGYQATLALAREARAFMLGIGDYGWQAPLHVDGFITDAELADMMDRGAVGELMGWAFDREGRILEGGVHERLTAVPIPIPARPRTVVCAAGLRKVPALAAALRGRLLTGLIIDEATAAALLDTA